ncbi:MAG TPA: class I SAM-dependent methyltransferase [Bryobacteraceae bacterium]|nr:class I SAM-dependent methyltransferase [Bryobacteraceae bacterium]
MQTGPAPTGALSGRPCPACSSPDLHVLFDAHDRLYRATTDRYRIIECAQCRLIRLDPTPKTPAILDHPTRWPTGDSAADRFERTYRRFLFADHTGFILRAIEEAGEGGPVLDLSPEGGLLRAILMEHGLPVIGLDHSEEAAAANSRAHGTPAVCADLLAAPLAPASCRAIAMLQVLEHLDSPVASIEAAYALLRPGGRLILQAPNAACWEFLLLGENWSGLDVPRHRINFRASDLESLLQAAGFEILRRKHFSLRDNPASLAMSLAPWLAPAVRRARGTLEGPAVKLVKHLLWCGLMAAALPFTLLEAACRAGSTVMIEARKKT